MAVMTGKLLQDGEPALEWSPVEDDGRNAPAVFYTKKVSKRMTRGCSKCSSSGGTLMLCPKISYCLSRYYI